MIRAVLFDLDGTLVDTERLQWRAYREALERHGVTIDLDEYARRFIVRSGGPEWVCRAYGLPLDPEKLRAEKARVYAGFIPNAVVACAGAAAALTRLAPHFALGVVTNSVRSETEAILGHLGLTDRLQVIVTREDYVRPKPSPDAYLEAARRLAVLASACVVVEDTPRGCAAGRAAGMAVVAVPNDLTAGADFSEARLRIARLDDLTAPVVRTLAAG